MIIRYTTENFYSIRESVTVDFTVSAKAGDREGLIPTERGYKVNTVTGVFGANASGKTNLLKSLGFLSWFVRDSGSRNPDERIPYEPFAFTLGRLEPTKFELEFEYGGELYLYQLDLLDEAVAWEALYIKKSRFNFLFKRILNIETGDYDFTSQELGQVAFVPQRANASWLSSALLQEHELALRLQPFFANIFGNLGPSGRVPIHDAIGPNMLTAADFYQRNPESLAVVSNLLSEFDLGLSGIEVKQSKVIELDGKEGERPLPFFLHTLEGNEYRLGLMQESHGTQTLFILLRYLVPVLQKGGVAYVDELETGLHPHMVCRILDLFFNPATNPKQAQLIATFHTDFLLRDTLNKYQIYFTEKDDTLSTDAYRLDSVRGVRNVDNIYEKYHAGAYGGIPELF